MVGLQPPPNFRMTTDEEIESEYFREDFMAQHLADEDSDANQQQPRNSYATKFKTWYDQCTLQEQKPFVDAVLAAAKADPRDKSIPRHFFLTGAGGTGKTFTYNVMNKHY
jgi:hypothetical protein